MAAALQLDSEMDRIELELDDLASSMLFTQVVILLEVGLFAAARSSCKCFRLDSGDD